MRRTTGEAKVPVEKLSQPKLPRMLLTILCRQQFT